MNIEKMKLNQHMRKEAVKDAIQFKFKKAVESYNSKLLKVLTDYALNRKANKLIIDEYSGLSDSMKRNVILKDKIYFSDKDGNRFILPISSNIPYLTIGGRDSYHPFMKNARQGYEYEQVVRLTFSKPMVETEFKFEGRIPAPIKKLFTERDTLMADISSFAHDAYHALTQVKSIKEVREYVPALEQFIPVPEKEFTKMVPYSFFHKVNKSVNL